MFKNNSLHYITSAQLISSVKQDLKVFDNASLIDEDSLIKTISYCNERLGDRTRKIEYKVIDIDWHKGNIPLNFYKVIECFVLESRCYNTLPVMPVIHTSKVITDHEKPEAGKIITTMSDCCNYVYTYETNIGNEIYNKQNYIIGQRLNLGSKILEKAINNYECSEQDSYEIDVNNNELETGIKQGKILFIYLSNLENEEGELLVPQHALLTPYYEYVIKEKILEDIMINSDADVSNKLQYISSKKPQAWEQANNYINSLEVDQFFQNRKERKQKYYTKWYSKF